MTPSSSPSWLRPVSPPALAQSPGAPHNDGAAGVGVDAQGNVYGAVVRRQMLERHVKK